MTQEATQAVTKTVSGGARLDELCFRQKPELDLTESEDGYMIYDAENDKVHYLNPTAVLILELCDGATSPTQIAQMIAEAYQLTDAPVRQVIGAISDLVAEGLIRV